MQRTHIVVRRDRDAPLQQHGTGIEPGVHLHDGNPGFRISGKQGTLDRRRPAPARQERRVHVKGAVASRVKKRWRKKQTVRRHHYGIRPQGAYLI
jgi:hypothetical protein